MVIRLQFPGALIGMLVLLACACPAHAADDAPNRPLNLLIIQTDEFLFRMLGCYGGEIVGTPHIDSLAAGGAIATRFYATTPVCSPSRASFMSGLYPQHTPVVTNDIPMDEAVVTFAERLQRQGYATGYAGKWHLDGQGKPQWAPLRQFGFADNRFMFNRGHWKVFELSDKGPRVAATNARGEASYGLDGADEHTFATDWLTDRAIAFLDTHAEEPFCYMLSLPDPHGPNTVRAPYDTMYDAVDYPIPASFNKSAEATPGWAPREKNLTANQLQKLMGPYFGMVKCIDDNVGRLLGEIERLGLQDHTLIVFTADHGDLCGEHGRLDKGVPYEGSARIPFVMACPGLIKPGTVVPQVVSTVDFAPSVLSLLGVPVEDAAFQGRDASVLFRGEEARDWQDVAILRGTGDWLCALNGRYKLVLSSKDRPWLFDLDQDPEELTNDYDRPENRDAVATLMNALADYGKRVGDDRLSDPAIMRAMAGAGGRN